MGMSKALMEKIAISNFNLNKKGPIISVTRYGNVLASRGSVVPLFIEQILNNKPVTITDPKMTRFIMPMDKAVQLVLFALKYGKGGEIFVQKTPATNIHNLLQAVLNIFDKKNYKINIIGTRHGEKHYESLLTREERAIAKDMGGYFCINSDQRDLNYDLYFAKGSKDISSYEDYNSNNTEQLTIEKTKKILLSLEIFKNKNYLVI
jgi:UDP-glucose 4-epimerase